MSFRIKSWLFAGSMIVSVAGCQEPKEITPVAPPGFELTRVPTTPQGEGAQAIGEQAAVLRNNKAKDDAATQAAASSPETPAPAPIGPPVKLPSGLVYEVLKEGTGEPAKVGQAVTIHYTGTLTDGKVFDSSRTRRSPFATTIGVGQVIKGWDEGVPGMKVGERRRLTIPSDLAYGPGGSPPTIPGNATLIFDVELLGVK